jgi:predicted GIY-YIG superfamily endonuclease
MPSALQIRHYHLYVLELEEQKFYVGVTAKDVRTRFMEHKHSSSKAHWTAKYPPISIVEAQDLGSLTYREATFTENRKVRGYMKMHGINSTRGGDLTGVENLAVLFGFIYDQNFLEAMLLCMFLLAVMGLLLIVLISR